MTYSNTQITGGHIGTTATGSDGKQSSVELFNSAQYDKPETPHTVVNAADGSQWYQVASGEGIRGGMIVYWVLKRRQQDSYDEWDDDEAE